MRVWLLKIGEPLPTDGAVRLHRYGILARMLSERGHQVTWWTSGFDHIDRAQRFSESRSIQIDDGYRIEALHARGYRRSVSLFRLYHHLAIARAFSNRAPREPAPDVVLTSFPVPELALASVRHANRRGVPVIVDVRDLWPDVLELVIPSSFRSLRRAISFPLRWGNRAVFRAATGVVAVSSRYLRWGLELAGREQTKRDRVFPLGYEKMEVPSREQASVLRGLVEQGLDRNRIVCCFFGMFGTAYDLKTVVEAARRLEDGGDRRFQFVLCGDGDKSEFLREQAEGLDSVLFPGWVNQATIHVLMGLSDIGLAAYAAGAPQDLPNKPIEYFSGGLPVLSSLQGELSKILEENDCGLTYAPGNLDSFLRALGSLTSSRERLRKMGRNAEQLYSTMFSADQVYDRMIEYLVEMAGKRAD